MHRWHYQILAILFRSFGFIACMDDLKKENWFSNLLTVMMVIPETGCTH
jgi:hypothetical protein